jgi:hypothetical protein
MESLDLLDDIFFHYMKYLFSFIKLMIIIPYGVKYVRFNLLLVANQLFSKFETIR